MAARQRDFVRGAPRNLSKALIALQSAEAVIPATLLELKLKVEASKGQANYRKRILDGKRTAIFILKKLSEDALRKT